MFIIIDIYGLHYEVSYLPMRLPCEPGRRTLQFCPPVGYTTTGIMTPAETEKALRALFKQLRPPARAICHFPKPPQRREVCGFSIFYRGALVREYFGKELLKEFEIIAREKGLM